MPSVRVKKGYRNLDDTSNDGRPRSQSLSAAPHASHAQEFEMAATLRPPVTRAWSSASTKAKAKPQSRPRAPSKVSNHILSRRHLPSVSSTPEAGPSYSVQSSGGETHRHHRNLLRRHQDTYLAEGEQVDLRVPNTGGHGGVDGSQVNRALRELEGEDFDRPDSVDEHHCDEVVEHLDVIDPQISTVCTLTNAANAIVVPPLSFYSRVPVVDLPRQSQLKKPGDVEKGLDTPQKDVSEDALDQHVQDVLTKRQKFRRMMAGVWSFLKTPLGIATAIYGFLVVFWGTAIVVFLIPIIDLHNPIQQGYWVELSQQIETGLFTLTSIGFIPFRLMDSYRVSKIWRYKRKIARVRRRAGLLELYDPDDLPDPVYDRNYVHVLTEKEQIDLRYQQHQFMKSQTWYRPHGTQTHRAFPITLAVWIIICNDLNSVFQCLLSGTMWGLDRFQRPAWTTATSLPAAFIAGILAGVFIYLGGRKTRRTQQVEDRLRLALEMECKAHKAKRAGSDSLIVVEAPEGLCEASTSTKVPSTSASDSNLAPAPVEEPSHGRKRKTSTGSLRFAEEMVVPPIDDLQTR